MERERSVVLLLIASSLVVVVVGLLTSFRLDGAAGVGFAATVNGARVGLGVAVGGLLGLAGALRRPDEVGPLWELRVVAFSGAGAATAWMVGTVGGAQVSPLVVVGAAGAVGLLGAVMVGLLEREVRWSNPVCALGLSGFLAAVAVGGSFGAEFVGPVAGTARWFAGDLGDASAGSALAAIVAWVVAVTLALAAPGVVSTGGLSWAAVGIAVGLAGPLAFVGTMTPIVVRRLAGNPSRAAGLLACSLGAAAAVVAVDATARLLVGGYALGWNVAGGMLAIPLWLPWNRARLRAECGAAGGLFETLEVGLIVGLTVAGGIAIALFTEIVRSAT